MSGKALAQLQGLGIPRRKSEVQAEVRLSTISRKRFSAPPRDDCLSVHFHAEENRSLGWTDAAAAPS